MCNSKIIGRKENKITKNGVIKKYTIHNIIYFLILVFILQNVVKDKLNDLCIVTKVFSHSSFL